jgi:hypothetical protein
MSVLDRDLFKERIESQLAIGTRHHHPDNIKKAYFEFSALALLRTTEPDEDDKYWWKWRATILAMDCDIQRPATMWQRRN